LENFDELDSPTATLLIDHLRFVTLSMLRDGLYTSLEALVEAGAFEGPAVVLPERSLGDLEEQLGEPAVAYRNFHPGKDTDVIAGSEAFVGMVLRDLPGIRRSAGDGPGWVSPGVDLEELRQRRCRSIVVVTDYMGTGTQITDFVRSLTRNRTIRSWQSFGWVKLYVVAFASSPAAIERVRRAHDVTDAWMVEAAPTFETAPWSTAIREAVTSLCITKCRLRPSLALGFRKSAGLFVTERGAPNNLPAVLWQDVAGWTPLFRDRPVAPEFAASSADYRGDDSLPDLAKRIGQERLGRNERLRNMRGTSRQLLSALILLNRGNRSAGTLSAELRVSVDRVEALLEFAKSLGFVDAEGRITQGGRKEIAANKAGMRRTTADLTGTDAPYYPSSLR
jgi:hypothetical protein